jgi:hypothetical protein
MRKVEYPWQNTHNYFSWEEYISKLNTVQTQITELRKKYELNDKEKKLYDIWLKYLSPSIEENKNYNPSLADAMIIMTKKNMSTALGWDKKPDPIQAFKEYHHIKDKFPDVEFDDKLMDFINELGKFESVDREGAKASIGEFESDYQKVWWRLKSPIMKKLIMYRYLKAFDEWIQEGLHHW